VGDEVDNAVILRIIVISRSERRKLGLRSQGGDVVLTGGTGPSVGGSIEDAFAVNVARGHRMPPLPRASFDA